MDQLVKRMLAVGSWLAPVNRTGIAGGFASIKCDMFAITLHCELLEISREPLQVLLIRKDGYGRCAKEVVVPNSQEPHENRQVALKGRCAEVVVHLVEAVQHGAKVIRADPHQFRKARPPNHRKAPPNPIPKPEHVRGINAELRYF